MTDIEVFARQKELAAATPAQLEAFAAASTEISLEAGELLYDVDDDATHVYYLRNGYLTAELAHPGRRSVTFGFGGPDHGSWGARDLYLGCSRSTRSIASIATTVLALPREVLEQAMRDNPALVDAAIAWLAVIERSTARQMGELGAVEVRRRLCHALVADFMRDGYIELPITQAELARILGLSRPTVSECMTGLVRRGWLAQVGPGRYRVLNPGALRHTIEPMRTAEHLPQAWARNGALPADADVLRRVPLLAGVPFADVQKLADASFVAPVAQGEIIVAQGGRCASAIVLLDGRAGSWVRFADGRGQRLRTVTPLAEVIGAEARYTNGGAPTEIRAEWPCSVAVVPQVGLARLAAVDAGFSREVLRQTAQQVRALADVKLALSQTSAAGRLAHALLEQNVGPHSVVQPITQKELGDALAMSRQSINYAVADLSRSGIIERTARGGYRVLDREALAARAAPS